MTHFRWEKNVSDIAFETARELRRLAEPKPEGDRVKAAIQRAARRVKFTYWRTYDLWYGRGVVKKHEALAIEEALAAKQPKAATNDISLESFALRIAALEAKLAAIDADFYRPDIARLGALALGIGRLGHEGTDE